MTSAATALRPAGPCHRKPHVALIKHEFFNTSIAMAIEAWRINSVLICRCPFLIQMKEVIVWFLVSTAFSDGQNLQRGRG